MDGGVYPGVGGGQRIVRFAGVEVDPPRFLETLGLCRLHT